MRRWLVSLLAPLWLAACGSAWSPDWPEPLATAAAPTPSGVSPAIVAAAVPLQCVPYARDASGIDLYGDAWTWWQSAAGRYPRDKRPAVGSVLVLSRTKQLRAGHLAVVTQVLDSRQIVVRHANWLRNGQIHLNTPVVDVSRANDWSAVRVWYTPGGQYGQRVYPASGFIHAQQRQAMS